MDKYGNIGDLDDNTRSGLQNTLVEGELFLGAISCSDAIRPSRQTRLVLTDRRLLSFKKSNGPVPVESINRVDIHGVQYDKGIISRELTIRCRNRSSLTWELQPNGPDDFVEAIQSQSVYPIYGGQPEEITQANFSVSVESKDSVSQQSQPRASTESSSSQTHSSNSKPQRSVYDLTSAEITSRLQGMDNYDFEHFVADLWERMGWQTEVSQESNDAGIDVIATKTTPYPEKKAIQVKRYTSGNTVGGPKIQQYASLKQQIPDADSAIVVTTSSFTKSAEKRAKELNVKTIDGEDLAEMIDELDARDLVSRYLDIPLKVSEPEPEPESEADLIADSESRTQQTPQQNQNRNVTHSAQSRSGTQTSPSSVGQSLLEADDQGSVADHNTTKAEANSRSHPSEYTAREESQSTEKSDLSVETASQIDQTGDPGKWHYGIIGLSLVEVGAYSGGVSSVIVTVALGIMIFTYLDIENVSSVSEWDPNRWFYIPTSFLLFFIAVPVYIYYRNKAVGL